MRILKVIHGYPMRYNAGSEVYTQTLCHWLARHHDVQVFTREEDAFSPDYQIRTEPDADDPRITLHIVNNPRLKDRYRSSKIDMRFSEVVDRFRPDIVHIGHLNHLSTSIIKETKQRNIPIVFTLHDYWLMCPRGQFMQTFPENPDNLWAACEGQADKKCAERCYARYFSGAHEERDLDIEYWAGWVARRMRHIRSLLESVDMFIAPSQYLYKRFRDDFGLPEKKLVYLDYGFLRTRLEGKQRIADNRFTFGYIGTHIPAKGIHDLVRAFGTLSGNAQLRIWGRPRGQDTESLKRIAASMPTDIAARIEWLPEYKNQEITRDVFNLCDAIVVPSVWVENSPLVIHEAQQARVPVITADTGGMSEYVHHDVNGLLYEHRSYLSLAAQMQRFVDTPELAKRLGKRGYLHSASGDIPSIEEHGQKIERIYKDIVENRSAARMDPIPAPWRITFDTNPDTCNLNCIMCEEHSPFSKRRVHCNQRSLPHRLMPIEMVERVIARTAPNGLREIIPSTMGEPLLYEHFDEILALCHKYHIKLNLTTNGTFPRHGPSVWAERIVPVASDVKISWNGASRTTYESIMRGSSWNTALANVKSFAAVRDAYAAKGGNRCRLSLQVTFMESNIGELADIVRLGIQLGIDRVKGHHLWLHFDELRNQSMRRDTAAIERWNTAVLAAREAAIEHHLPNGQQILLENIFLLDESAKEDIAPGAPCPFLGQEAWISATGRFAPCCAPDAQRRTLGDFGSLAGTEFMEIWAGEGYRQLISTYQNRPLCRSCNMRKPAGH